MRAGKGCAAVLARVRAPGGVAGLVAACGAFAKLKGAHTTVTRSTTTRACHAARASGTLAARPRPTGTGAYAQSARRVSSLATDAAALDADDYFEHIPSFIGPSGARRLQAQLEDMDTLDRSGQTVDGKVVWAEGRLMAWFIEMDDPDPEVDTNLNYRFSKNHVRAM